ncbi:T9SS type B sorting domain-containing protein [Nonlabens ponticola]|uniref:T9SS type B sorting domain-containing protein n=1 Tax=Nonlabens ponticola TaxID=2496866 RepID=A0A3S9MZA7_9FLAO|nr:T9SS type B sorting domain-containing protein [Nonlabens ponticola]AZQ44596.1 T9SS type B sorting domain-containing protein [Nonlabens ponticola]
MIKQFWIAVVVVVLGSQIGLAQLEASNWYFGDEAGLNFDPNTGAVTALTDGRLQTDEGCATISDSDGNLLFYTDGIVVYNRNHRIMPRGAGLKGDPSSTQSAIIIPKPGDPDIYYIFTVDTRAAGGEDSGLHYYIVDMTLEGGLGDVTTSIRNPPNLIRRCSEKISAITSRSGDKIFVVGYAGNNENDSVFDTFYSFEVTNIGVNETPNKFTVTSQVGDIRGYLKFSPDGELLASANMTGGTFIYDFDDQTGAISNERELTLTAPNDKGYGVEFSPSSEFLYVTGTNDFNDPRSVDPNDHTATLYQFDVSTVTPQLVTTLYDGNGYRGALQLGIDSRIYYALSESYPNGLTSLGVINSPDLGGTFADYDHEAIPLSGRRSRQGLPPFIQSFFALIQAENLCFGDDTEFSFETNETPSFVEWDFGDGTTSNDLEPTHVYGAVGTYEVTLTLTIDRNTRTYNKTIEIYEVPVANPATDLIACDSDNDGSVIFDFTETTNEILASQDRATTGIRYFLSQADANTGTNVITSPYTLNLPTQEIVARVDNRNNTDCFDTTTFQLSQFAQPVANPADDLEACDDNFDGIETFDLDSQRDDILLNQDPADFQVDFFDSLANAQSNTNPLPDSYRNTRAFSQTIYVRVTNNNEGSCVDTSTTFDLIVQERPVAVNFDAFQCDEDGIADNRTSFNLSSFNQSIANGRTDVTVDYFLTQNDADNDRSELDDREYNNIAPSQRIIARVTDNSTGCSNTSTVTLSVSASDAQDTQVEVCDDDGLEDGLYLFNLRNIDDDVLVNAPSDVTVNYYETLDDALAEFNALPDNYQTTMPEQQVIYARAESPDGNCFGISEVTLIVNPLPQLQRTEDVEYCGNDIRPVTIDAGDLQVDQNDLQYQWSTGETTYSIDVREGGDYTVIATNSNGCSQQRVVTVIISEPATIDRIEIINANGGATGSATVFASGRGDYAYRISEDQVFTSSTIFENLRPGIYTLEVTDLNGCGSTFETFNVVGYPRFFTPNADGFNDTWQLDGVSANFEPDATTYIFDRYGKLLKELIPGEGGWDGTLDGEPLPSTDYWFKATLTDGTEFSAHFALKR